MINSMEVFWNIWIGREKLVVSSNLIIKLLFFPTTLYVFSSLTVNYLANYINPHINHAPTLRAKSTPVLEIIDGILSLRTNFGGTYEDAVYWSNKLSFRI